MRWVVKGADKASGKDVVVVVQAMNSTEAQILANNRGVLVSSVEPEKTQSALVTEAIDREIDARAEALPSVAASHSTATAQLDYHRPSPVAPTAPRAPEYHSIVTGASALQGLGWLLTAFGALLLVGLLAVIIRAIIAKQSGTDTAETREIVVPAVCSLLVSGLVLLIAGVFVRMFGVLALAIRDIARNSFRV